MQGGAGAGASDVGVAETAHEIRAQQFVTAEPVTVTSHRAPKARDRSTVCRLRYKNAEARTYMLRSLYATGEGAAAIVRYEPEEIITVQVS